MRSVKILHHTNFYNFIRKNKKKLEKTHYKEFNRNYEKILQELKKSLNEFHKINFSKRQWEIILGPWLLYSFNIYFFYNNYFSKKKNKVKVLKKYSFILPLDFKEFYNLTSNYKFFENFVLLKKNNINEFNYKKITNIGSKKIKFIINKLFRYISFFKKTILLNELKLDKIDLIKIMFFSHFKFIPSFTNNLCNYIFIKKKGKARISFFSHLKKKNLAQEEFINFLKYTMPTIYLENFNIILKYAKQNFPKSNVFVTESSYVTDDFFKINCALNKKNKINILQHGGNMRLYKNILHDFHENRISNKILVWGIKRRSLKEIFLPSNRLKKFIKQNKVLNKTYYHYCFVIDPVRVFNVHFFKFNSSINSLRKILKFNKLTKTKKNIIKLHYDTYGTNILKVRDISNLLGINAKYLTTDFKKVLESQIVIVNYFSTLFFELINLEKPVFIILDKKEHFLSKFGEEIFYKLKKNNLLFDDFASFVKFSSNIKLEKWWHRYENQKFVAQFKKDYCNIRDSTSLTDLVKKIC